MSKLANRALLVHVGVKVWTGRRLDKAVTNQANNAHGADRTAGSYHKRLLPDAKSLKAIEAKASAIRNYIYEKTLPWLGDGTRIIPSDSYMAFSAAIRAHRNEFDQLVAEFVTDYPTLRDAAKKALGGMFNVNDYPYADQLASRFGVEVSYMPMPVVSDFRVEVDTDEFTNRMKQLERDAVKAVFTRLYEVVKVAAEKLGKSDAVFRDSLISNIEEVVKAAPDLNVTEDSELETTINDLGAIVARLQPETLRGNMEERELAARRLADMEKRLRGSL